MQTLKDEAEGLRAQLLQRHAPPETQPESMRQLRAELVVATQLSEDLQTRCDKLSTFFSDAAACVRAAVLEGLGWQCAPPVRDLLLRVSDQIPSL